MIYGKNNIITTFDYFFSWLILICVFVLIYVILLELLSLILLILYSKKKINTPVYLPQSLINWLNEIKKLAHCWGAQILEAGEQGHIDSNSGHGPWPEGLLVFIQFLKKLNEST